MFKPNWGCPGPVTGAVLLLIGGANGVLGQTGRPSPDSARGHLVSRVEFLGGVGIVSAAFLLDDAARNEVQEVRAPTTNRLASTMLRTGAAFMLKAVVGRARPFQGGDLSHYRPFSGLTRFRPATRPWRSRWPRRWLTARTRGPRLFFSLGLASPALPG